MPGQLAFPHGEHLARQETPLHRIVDGDHHPFAENMPVALSMVCLPQAAFPHAAAALATSPSVTSLFTMAGHVDYRRAWTRIGTRLASPEEARHLQQSRERPVLATEALDVAASGVPLAHNDTVWAGERVSLTVES